MFERFTQSARNAVTGAQQVARDTGSRTIDTRHLLIALVEAPGPAATALAGVGVRPAEFAKALRAQVQQGGLDESALAAMGIDLDTVRAKTDAVFGPDALDRVARPGKRGHLPFTADAKKALELALREAIRLRQNRIDGGHVLLGLIRDSGTPAAAALDRAVREAGADISVLRAAVEQQLAEAS